MAEKIQITIKNNLSELEKISNWIENLGVNKNLDSKDVFSINLVLDELLTNIISYGFSDDLIHLIEIDFNILEKIYEITIKDDGVNFNPLEKSDPDINLSADERRIGGLGIYIVKKNVDDINYERKGSINILRIVKKRRFIE